MFESHLHHNLLEAYGQDFTRFLHDYFFKEGLGLLLEEAGAWAHNLNDTRPHFTSTL